MRARFPKQTEGITAVLSPMSGETGRWAPPTASPSPPATQAAQPAPAAQAVAGGAAPAIANAMDRALLAFASRNEQPVPGDPNTQDPAAPVDRPHQGGAFLNSGTATTTALRDITNTDTLGAADPVNDPLGSFMQQVALAAYTSGYASGLENANTSSSTGFHA